MDMINILRIFRITLGASEQDFFGYWSVFLLLARRKLNQTSI